MKIKVSKVMAKYISAMKQELKIDSADVVTMSGRQYRMNGGDDWDNTDYDCETGRYKMLRITYPANFFACARYITTSELVKEFSRLTDKSEVGFREMLKSMIMA